MNRCRQCAHLHRETESYEMPHIWWWECAARPGMANLRSFPFQATKCGAFAKHPGGKPKLPVPCPETAAEGLGASQSPSTT